MKVTCSVCGLHVEGRKQGPSIYPAQHKNYAGARCSGDRYPARESNGSDGTGYCRQPKREEARR